VVRKFDTDLPTPLKPQQILQFSWTHVLELLRLDDSWKRAFYENECLLGLWSVRQLQQQIGSQLYERTGLSKISAPSSPGRGSNRPKLPRPSRT